MTIEPKEYLEHYGIGGMKWGLRRYQNPDGSLTEEGRERYGRNTKGRAKLYTRQLRDNTNMQRDMLKREEKLTNKESNASDKKLAKIQNEKAMNKVLMESTQKRIDSIISDATANHYKVTSKVVTRGNNIINKMLKVSPTTIPEYKVKKTRYSSV